MRWVAPVEMTVCASQNDMGGVALVEMTCSEVVLIEVAGIEVVSEWIGS